MHLQFLSFLHAHITLMVAGGSGGGGDGGAYAQVIRWLTL